VRAARRARDASVDLSVCSPAVRVALHLQPVAARPRQQRSRDEFLEHYGFVIREQLRVTKPGRLACVHVQQITTQKACTASSA
jgi:hypothetical protein